MTIHTFDYSYAGLSASEIQSPSCHHIFAPGRRSGNLFINETGNRHFHNFSRNRDGRDAVVGELHGHSSARMLAYNRENPNFNFNEVIL
jgi:hypothetical protein